jgi:hypothetical protein
LESFNHIEHSHDAPEHHVEESPISDDQTELASAIGNHAFTDLVAGEGVLPDGSVHPAVQQTLARTQGGGAPLDGMSAARFSEGLGESIADVRIHTDATADSLNDAVSARAFTTGSDIYFAQGEYRPGTSDGDRLLAHELSHVIQQRGAPATGDMTVSEPGDALETEAEATARELAD